MVSYRVNQVTGSVEMRYRYNILLGNIFSISKGEQGVYRGFE